MITTKLNRARWHILQRSPFYGSLLMSLPDATGGHCGSTAATDGRTIFWNEEFVQKLSEKQLRFVMLHEILHCAHGHMWRLPNDKLGNMAGDYAINAQLIKERAVEIEMPPVGLLDPQYFDKAEEVILADLRKKKKGGGKGPKEPGEGPGGYPGPGGGGEEEGEGDGPGKGKNGRDGKQGGGNDPGGCGGFVEPKTSGPAETKELKDIWNRKIIQAVQAQQASGRGDVPGGFARIAEALCAPPKVDWKSETADFLKQSIGTRNDWSRSARRHAMAPVIMPRKHRDHAGMIVCARDTSGSIGGSTLAAFSSAIEECAAELGAEVVLMDCDAAISMERRIPAGERIPLDAPGGGGTDFRPVFRRVEELTNEGEQIAGVVYLTDLCGPEPESVDLPTLWLCTTDSVAKTGRTVKIEA